jgi:hypothetical protein
MLNEKFVEEIAKLTRAGTATTQIDQYTTVGRNSNGEFVSIERNLAAEANIAFTIESLAANVKTKQDACAEIYYSRRGIRGFYDVERRDSITMFLTPSKPFAQLEAWDNKPEVLKQIDLFNLLKTTFRGCIDGELERIVRSIKWNIGNQGEAQVRQGAVSMSKAIIAEMSGAEDLNKIEYVTFTVPVFKELPNIKAIVECHIRPLPDQQCFAVIPTGTGIEDAYQLAEDFIGGMIAKEIGESGIPCYCGAANADNVNAAKMV